MRAFATCLCSADQEQISHVCLRTCKHEESRTFVWSACLHAGTFCFAESCCRGHRDSFLRHLVHGSWRQESGHLLLYEGQLQRRREPAHGPRSARCSARRLGRPEGRVLKGVASCEAQMRAHAWRGEETSGDGGAAHACVEGGTQGVFSAYFDTKLGFVSPGVIWRENSFRVPGKFKSKM